jgi:hypothetical protein
MGWGWVHSVLRPLLGPLYQPRMVMIRWVWSIEGMRIGRGERSTRRKSAPVPHIQHKFHMTRPGIEPEPRLWEMTQLTPCSRLLLEKVVSPRLPDHERPCHSSGGYSPASHCSGPDSSPGQVMWDFWWTMWHWGRFSQITLVSPVNSHSTDFSIFIIIYHPGLVQ